MQELYNSNKRKVLFIAYLFPPVGGSGVQRSAKFVKYLPSFGWEPLVLTVKEPYDFYSDKDLENDVKDKCRVFRTFSIEPMKWVRKLIIKKWQKNIRKNKSSNESTNKTFKPGFLVKLKTYLLIPDNEILWLPFAVWRGWRIIKKERPDVIYSTSAPYTDHLIALVLSKISGIPWVVDFRDLWVDRQNFPENKWRLYIDRKLEKDVINNAAFIVTATSLMTDRFNELYPDKKYTTITNGYDEDDFSSADNLNPPEDEFAITYTGIFNRERNPEKFFLALKKIIEQREDFRNKVKLKLIGQLDNPGDFTNYFFFKSLELDKYSEVSSYQPHSFVTKEMCTASVLLLFIGEKIHAESILTGKIFEYLRAGRPILAVVPPKGLAAEVIRNTNSGIVVSRDNEDEIAAGILKMFELFLNKVLDKSFERINIEKYNRQNLTGDLTRVFESVINKN